MVPDFLRESRPENREPGIKGQENLCTCHFPFSTGVAPGTRQRRIRAPCAVCRAWCAVCRAWCVVSVRLGRGSAVSVRGVPCAARLGRGSAVCRAPCAVRRIRAPCAVRRIRAPCAWGAAAPRPYLSICHLQPATFNLPRYNPDAGAAAPRPYLPICHLQPATFNLPPFLPSTGAQDGIIIHNQPNTIRSAYA
jgi:hypothetical protein